MQDPSPRLSQWQFVNKIIKDAHTGWSFVPLIGSGLSSPSGIIMGMEFTNYLAFCNVLGIERSRRAKQNLRRRIPSAVGSHTKGLATISFV